MRRSDDEPEVNPVSPTDPATPTTEPDQFLRVEELVRDGERVSVIKDWADQVAFPGLVPQEVDTVDQVPTTSEPHAESSLPTKQDSGPIAPTSSNHGTPMTRAETAPIRPTVETRWATRAPSFPLAPRRRAGTSYISQAMLENNKDTHNWEQDGYYSSSSSSSDGQDENGAGTDGESEAEAEPSPAKVRSAQARRDRWNRGIAENRRFSVGNENYMTQGKMKKDGRLRITVKETANTGYLAKALGQAAKKVVPSKEGEEGGEGKGSTGRASASTLTADAELKPRLNIVIMVVGSRGDAQPFLKIGKILKEQYGHRVRIATHPAFRDFIEQDSGLEFFSVGGDPSELMAFMVKNPGMIPTLETVKAGDIGKRRAAMAEMFQGFWRACINVTDDEKDLKNLKMMGERDPFVADAIIANPPSFAHIHCAEALGIPMHLMFTFPYTPTQSFPHPLASIKKSNVDPGYTNFISYPLVEMMVWQGLGDLVNDFRVNTLKLDPLSTLWAPGQTYRLHVPFTYLWSPGLVPKPEDWGPEVDISGFVFLDLASSFQPPSDLEQFLSAGEAPIYIGFGSIVVDDPDRFTQMIFEAVRMAGVRVLLSKGWGGLGGEEDVPENVFMLGNTPHDWLFPRVKACVIHGGAGTTAIALKCGKPTMAVPFFGDQHFWGSMLGSSGAGPQPVPYKSLDADKLAEGIEYCLTEEARAAAAEIAGFIESEGDGAVNAVRSFHHHLNLTGMNSIRCSILHDRVACWKLKRSTVKLSSLAADIAVEKGLVSWKKMRLLRHTEWNDFEGPGEPVTGVFGSLATSMGNAFGGIGSVPYRMAKTSHKREEKKKRKQKRMKEPRNQKSKGNAAAAATANGNLHEHSQTRNEEAPNPTNGAKLGEPSKTDVQQGAERQASQQQPDDSAASNGGPTRPGPQGRLTTGTLTSVETASTAGNFVGAYAEDVGEGIGKSAEAIAKVPVDISVALAQGFHNAPRLYGDDTVRRPPRVTGIRSGLRAARYEFAYGVYDGTTGLVRLPVRGAKKGGAIGFVKGTGMGLTGFVLKHVSAIVGPIGYTLKGVVKQTERSRQPDRVIRRARTVQGQREARQLGTDRARMEREVEEGWNTLKALWEALEHAERKKGGLRGRFGAKKRRGLHAAFESVGIAERTLAAVRRGEDVSAVVGTEAQLKRDEERVSSRERRSADARKKEGDDEPSQSRVSPGKSSSRHTGKGAVVEAGDGNDGVNTTSLLSPDGKQGGGGDRNAQGKTARDIPEDAAGELGAEKRTPEMPVQNGAARMAAA